jgi:hypothetical protein
MSKNLPKPKWFWQGVLAGVSRWFFVRGKGRAKNERFWKDVERQMCGRSELSLLI